jgi:predicted GTPase
MPAELTPEEEAKLRAAWADEIDRRPLSIGVVGVSGVGKSSTINAMFKVSLPISHTVACTKEFRAIPMSVTVTDGPGTGSNTRLVVHDAPGLGEDTRRDPDYLAMYQKNLPECDIILWVMAARNRAIALDQQYLRQLADFQDRIVFGISQVDLVEPRNWNPRLPIPSVEQEAHIREIVADRSARLSDTLGRKVEAIPYSNYMGYNLEWLFSSLIEACTTGRKWLYQGLKNFKLEDWIVDEEVRARMSDSGDESRDKQGQRSGFFSRLGSAPKGAKKTTAGGSIIEALRALFPHDSAADERIRGFIRETIGRDDIESRPLTANEIDTLQARIRVERAKIAGSGL